jgi:chondroitin 4-sulfotransferase 11
MFILPKQKALFIHNHRTGGTSFTNALRLAKVEMIVVGEQHVSLTKRNEVFQAYPTYEIIGFMRNPWERMVSWYLLLNFNRVDKSEFEMFLLDVIKSDDLDRKVFNLNQMDYFINENNLNRKMKIGRFENLEEDARQILDSIGIKIDHFPFVNTTHHFNYRDFYNEKSQKIIAQHCKQDIESFGYTYE